MLKNAIFKAERAFSRAAGATNNMRFSANLDELQDAWLDYLDQIYKIYAKLEAGSKASGSSRGWFERKVKQRQQDPLLSYVYQARNVETHGLTDTSVKGFGLRADGGVYVNKLTTDSEGHISFADIIPANPDSYVTVHPSIMLRDVIDERFQTVFPVPTEHFGKPLADDSPLGLATVSLDYFRRMIDEARKL